MTIVSRLSKENGKERSASTVEQVSEERRRTDRIALVVLRAVPV